MISALYNCAEFNSVAVNEQSQFRFTIAQGTLPWQPIFVGFIGFYV